MGRNLDEICWKVVESVTEGEISPDVFCGAQDEAFYTKLLGEEFFDLWPGDFWGQWESMVKEIKEVINPQRKKDLKRPIKPPTRLEILKFLACMITAAQYSQRGINLFGIKKIKQGSRAD